MENNIITIDDFLKVDLRIATVLDAEEVQDSAKLLKLKVSLGSEERQVVAGIRKSYSALDLIGKQIVIIANLQPRKLAELESYGMLLAVHDADGNSVLVVPQKDVPAGNKIG